MKLSEARFKPLFLRLLEWSNAAPPGDGSALSRPLLLFSGAEALAGRLRSVFVPYFTYLLDGAVLHLAGDGAAEEGKKAKKKRRKAGSEAPGAALSAQDEVERWLLRYKVRPAPAAP